MRVTELKEAVQRIKFDTDKQERMILAIQGKKGRSYRFTKTLRIAASLVVCILALGILSVPVRALVNSLVQERMEAVPAEEIEKIGEQLQSQRTEADGVTREYTEEERARREKLYAQYLDGLFPEGELIQVDSEDEAAEHEFCFLTTTSVYYLPTDRTLTDEEILEQIDFERKRDYALQEQHAEEIAEREAAKKEQIKKVIASGGVTEEQAVEIAARYLEQIFDLNGDGMELNHYYENPNSDVSGLANTYCVNWSNVGGRKYYYFYIDAADGTLRSVSYSGDIEESIAIKPSAADAVGKAKQATEAAQNFLKEKMKILENFEEVKSCYRVYTDDDSVGRLVDTLFIKADGTVHVVECRWDGQISGYYVTTKEVYEETQRAIVKSLEKQYAREKGRETQIEVMVVVGLTE